MKLDYNDFWEKTVPMKRVVTIKMPCNYCTNEVAKSLLVKMKIKATIKTLGTGGVPSTLLCHNIVTFIGSQTTFGNVCGPWFDISSDYGCISQFL